MKKIILNYFLLFSASFFAQNWGEQILIQPNVGQANIFGYSVAIDNEYAVVSSPGEDNGTGSVHVYKRDDNGVWNHHQKLEAFVGQAEFEAFGYAIALHEDFLFISSPDDRLNEANYTIPAGSVFIYKKDVNGNFQPLQRIRASDASHSDTFGSSVDADGDFLIVGAQYEDEDENGGSYIANAGSVYIFKRDLNDNWSQIQKIVPSVRSSRGYFGSKVALSGNFLIINDSSRNIFVFKKGAGGDDTWTEIQRIQEDDNYILGDIDIYDDYIAFGAAGTHLINGNWFGGKVIIYKKDDILDVWNENQVIRVANSSSLGKVVSMDSSFLLVTDPTETIYNNDTHVLNVGKSYLFLRDNNNEYLLRETIVTSEVQTNSTIGFGSISNNELANGATAIGDNYFILGAPLFDVNNVGASGIAFISRDVMNENNILGEDITWTGGESDDWNDPLNWFPNTVPQSTNDVILENVANAPNIANGQNHTINNLTTFENLNIETNASLTIQGNVDQRAQITLNSALDSSGSLIVNGNHTNPNPSNTIYNRFVTGDNSTWHLISSPLTNVDIDNFASNEPLAVGQNNANRGLSWYNNINENWEYYQDGAVDSGNFVVGKGYGINTSVDTSLEFSGVIKADNLEDYPINENANGWNIVGNPYTAYLRTNADTDGNANFLTENADELDPAFANLYLWNPSTNSYEPVGNDSERAFIAPGQSFFVKAKNGGGLIKINKTMLNAQSNNTFLKQETSKKIEINLNSENNTSKSTIVFKKDMTNGLDVTYDAAVFDGTTNNHYVYSRILDGSFQLPFAIQFLPELNDNEYIIPLGLKSNDENLNLTFNSNISESVDIILEDKKFNLYTNINTNNGYEFQFNKDVDENRFFLHVQNKALNLDNNVKDKISIYKNSESSLLIKGAINGILNIYTITGKKAIESKIIKESKQQIQLPRLKSGVYICEIKTNATKVVQKFIF